MILACGSSMRPAARPASPWIMEISASPTEEFEPEHLRTVDQFYKGAKDLRATFDERFAEPRQAHADRFVWDYWYVPGQYTLHRTQAASYFDPEQFEALTEALTAFGQKELGCRSISPPWLSFYVDGSEQALHADVPQGPFAYVLSLTNWDERAFIGGETTILQPAILDFWRGFDSSQGLEFDSLFTSVTPDFNRLTCFDARLPHGVRRVEGERDPRSSRLVIHGWFTEPTPFFTGGLSDTAVEEGLGEALQRGYSAVGAPCVTGLLSLRVHVSGADGSVTAIDRLADTLVVDPSELSAGADLGKERNKVISTLSEALASAQFEACGDDSQLTVPFVFD